MIYLGMEHLIQIPNYQPIAFPAPLWLLQLLLVLGFFIHLIPMNVSLAGGLVSAIFIKLGKGSEASYATRLGVTLAHSLPLFLSFAITQGIVPLLFLQLVYGPLYYSSSILMAAPWLSVIFILLTGYYLLYIYKFKKNKQNGLWLLLLSTLLFMLIGFFFTNNMTLMLNPDNWLALAHKPHGIHLNLADPQVLPRFLHVFVGSFAITGIAIGCFGIYYAKKDPKYSEWLIKKGSAIYALVTLSQFLIGAWFLVKLPREQMMNFMGQEQIGTICFIASLVFTVLSLIAGFISWNTGSRLAFNLTLITSLLTVLLMVVMRHLLRHYATIALIDPATVPVKIQWDLLIAFIVFALLLIVYLVWLVKLAIRAFEGKKVN